MAQLSATARAFVAEPRFAVLATINRSGRLQQSVVWYELDGDEIVFNTRRGRVKDRNMRRDPRISICVVDGYRYVAMTGQAVLIDDPQTAQGDMRRITVRYHGEEEGERQYREEFAHQERVTIRLAIETVHEYGL